MSYPQSLAQFLEEDDDARAAERHRYYVENAVADERLSIRRRDLSTVRRRQLRKVRPNFRTPANFYGADRWEDMYERAGMPGVRGTPGSSMVNRIPGQLQRFWRRRKRYQLAKKYVPMGMYEPKSNDIKYVQDGND